MPSFSQQITDNRIIIVVQLTNDGGPTRSFHALVDTGAQITAVSPRVVSELKLIPVAQTKLVTASGENVDSFRYRAKVDIPIAYNESSSSELANFRMGNNLLVAGLPYQRNDYDVILGMDFIGLFHITMYRNRIILSN